MSALLRAFRNGVEIPAIILAPQCLPATQWEPDAVARFIEDATPDYEVDRARIYLVGYNMGGYGTWCTAAAYPELFAAIVPICGGGELGDAATLSTLPIWTFHGAKDDIVPFSHSQRMIGAIRTAGGEPKLTVLPEAGHGICNTVCSRFDLWSWLLQQRNGGTTRQTC